MYNIRFPVVVYVWLKNSASFVAINHTVADLSVKILFSKAFNLFLDPSDIEGNMESATVIDLIPWMEYEFRIIATNTLGTGEPSMPSQRIRTEGART